VNCALMLRAPPARTDIFLLTVHPPRRGWLAEIALAA